MTLAQLVPLNLAQLVKFKNPKLGPVNNFTAYMYIYIYAVELKTGPIFAFSSVKNWSNCFVLVFFVFENLILPAERRGFFTKKKKKNKQKNNISSVRNWSNFVAQHTWTSF